MVFHIYIYIYLYKRTFRDSKILTPISGTDISDSEPNRSVVHSPASLNRKTNCLSGSGLYTGLHFSPKKISKRKKLG